MAKYELNDNQKKAIQSDNPRILVSASAGTGKTFVMVERVINLILTKKIPIDKFLLVTFAKASAEEMRERIYKALYDNVEKDVFLIEQLKKLPLSAISTLHSFCADLIRQYFYAINVPPKFSVLEPTKISLIKDKVIEELFDEKYEKKDENFLRLADIFAVSRQDKGLKEIVLSLFEFSRGLDDPDVFLTCSAFSNYDHVDVFKRILANRIDRKLHEFKNAFVQLSSQCNSNVLFADKTMLLNFVTYIDDILNTDNLANKLSIITDIAFTSLKALSKDALLFDKEIHENIKTQKTDLKKFFDKTKELSDIVDDDASISKIKNDVISLSNLTVEFAKAYADEKMKIDSLDFSDMEHFALKLLNDSDVLADIQARFDYIFVDEYQDTSKVQEALISAISSKNLFMVGDIKQSIYSFRQCDKNIFASKEKKYRQNVDGQLIFLNQNFRSGGKILSFVNQVFKNIMTAELGDDYEHNSMFDIKDDYGDVEMDILVTSKENEPALPKVYSVLEDLEKDDEFLNAQKEGRMIASKIKSLVGTSFFDGKITRQIRFSDFAILLRSISSTHAENIFKTLKDSGIPVTISASDSSLLDYPEVCQVMNFLSVLINFQKDIPLISVLRSPFFSFDDNELLDIRQSGEGKFFFECLKSIKSDHKLFPKIKSFMDTINFYRQVALARGGIYALSRAISELPFETLVRALPYGSEKFTRVEKFLQLIQSIDENKNLVELYLSIEKLKDELKLKDSDVSGDAVKMITIHKSKGLEFPICFVCGITRQFNPKSATEKVIYHADFGIALKDFDIDNRKRKKAIPYEAISKIIADENIEEELRILYVALTRAKNMLFLTCTVPAKKDGELTLSDLASPITSSEGVYSANTYLKFLLGAILNEKDCKIKINIINDEGEKQEQTKLKLENTLVDESVKDAVLCNLEYSYPHTVDLTLPTKFSASSLKRQIHIEEDVAYAVRPRFSEDASKIGLAYHKILELSAPFATFEDVQKTVDFIVENKLFTSEIMQKVNLNSCVKTLSLPFMDYGVQISEKPFIGYFEAEKFTEYKSNNKVLIQGVIDLLLYNEASNSCVLVDYKFSKVQDDKILKERYREQLEIYRYAVTHILKLKVEKTYIVNVSNGHYIEIE